MLESSKEVTESSYKMLFQIADTFLQKVDIHTEKNHSLLSIKTKEIQSEVINWWKTWTIQHERDISEKQWVTENIIDSIAKIIQADQETFTLHSREYKLYLKWFKKPFPQWRADYYGYFQNNMWVEWMHLLLYRNKDRLKERKIVFSSWENLWIHDHLYYYIQINYYLKYQKILPKEVVYANLYHELNQVQSNWWLYDISIYKKQYKQFIESIIWPFSKESLTSKSRTIQDHIVFAWLAWTWKSQFMQTLLTQKEYVYNKQTLTLNATVMSININEFLVMITQNNFFIQRIYKNTGLPIILVIEDLDTILSDETEAWNNIVQAITNFLQWVGETPITLITSTNFLHRFPQRILRPWRFNKIIWFDLELTNEEFSWIIRQHITNNKLKEPKKREELLEKNKHRMKHFSAAYLAKVIQNIAAHHDFQTFNKVKNWEKELLLNTILDTMIIPLEDINHANAQYKETMKKVTAQLRAPIWYKKQQQ